MRVFALLFVVFAGFAQSPEIRGVVREPGTNAPVSDAEVTIDYHGEVQPQVMPSPPKSTATVKTDGSGKFLYHPDDFGYFNVKIKKEGYTPGGAGSGIGISNEAFTLSAVAPSHEIKFFLSRPVRVAGKVVEDGTDKPVAGLRLTAVRANNFAGRRMFMGSQGTTDADGKFAISGQPGDYAVEVRPRVAQADRVRMTFKDSDLEAIDQDYAHTYWPGGRDQQAAIPINIASGASFDVGLIAVRKVPYYRVHVKVPPEGCIAGDTLDVSENTFGYQGDQSTITIKSKVPCGDMLITGFAPGSYRLVITTGKGADGRHMASVPFVINDKNVEITAALETGITLEGKFVTEQGARQADFSTFRVPMLSPLGGVPFADVMIQNKVNSDGTFRVAGMPAVNHRLNLTTLPGGFYVKEVRYNGAVVPDGIIQMESPSMMHSLTLVLDDKPATVTGTVTDGDKAVGGAWVIAARWPLPLNQIFIATASAPADEQGRFQITGLAPGEYRFVALRSREDDRDRAPGKLEKALAASDKVELSARAMQNLGLKPADVR